MDLDWLSKVSTVKGPFPVAVVGLVAAIFMRSDPSLSFAAIGVAICAFVYGLVSEWRSKRSSDEAETDEESGTPVEKQDHLVDVLAPTEVENPPPAPVAVDALDWVIFVHLKRSEQGMRLGRPDVTRQPSGDVREELNKAEYPENAHYFVDLREAALVERHCEVIADRLIELVRARLIVENYHGVLIPKAGNPVLGMLVARRLNLRPVVVREWSLYGSYLETVLQSGRLFLVDDVWAQGDVLIEAVRRAREGGFVIREGFVCIERTEGHLRAELEAERVTLESVRQLGDQELESLEYDMKQAAVPLRSVEWL